MSSGETIRSDSHHESNYGTWSLDLNQYDRTPTFSLVELEALVAFTKLRCDRVVIVDQAHMQGSLARLMQPVRDALALVEGEEQHKMYCTHLLLRMCARDGRPFWAWERETWIHVLGTSTANFFALHKPGNPTNLRQCVIAVAYLLNCFSDFQALGGIETASLAYKVFGRERVEATVAPILAVNAQWGYSRKDGEAGFRSVIAETLLLNRSPLASDLTRSFLEQVHVIMAPIPRRRAMIYRLSRILVHLGLVASPLPLLGGLPASPTKLSVSEASRQNGSRGWNAGSPPPPVLRALVRI